VLQTIYSPNLLYLPLELLLISPGVYWIDPR